LQVRFQDAGMGNYVIKITDIKGRIVKEEKVQASSRFIQANIDVQSLSSELYIIEILNSRKERIGIQRFMKN